MISYLGMLGVGDAALTTVISLLETDRHSSAPFQSAQAELVQDLLEEDPLDTTLQKSPKEPAFEVIPVSNSFPLKEQRPVRLFLAEEQQILKEAYLSFLRTQPAIEILGSCDYTSGNALVAAAEGFKPDAMLLGVKTVQSTTVKELEKLRQTCPRVGIVLLFAFYDAQGVRALREYSKDASSGCAYLHKHTIDTVEQLTQVILSVIEGRVILQVDPIIRTAVRLK